jgi:nucleoside-diphosphate-sugar epimerase
MKVVITGATGNLGTSVLSALAEDARVHEIVGLARRLPDVVFEKTRFVAADVASTELEPHFRGADAVIHLAWRIQSAHSVEELERANVVGSWRVFRAAGAAGVPILMHASSVGAYSRSEKVRLRDESWPTEGIPSSLYSRQKARVERLLDEFEGLHRGVRSLRFRPALIFKRSAATHVRELFLGPIPPRFVFSPRVLRWVPDHPDFRFQAVHANDVAEAFRLALFSEARGAFNLAAEPVLDSKTLARALSARRVGVRPGLLRAAVAAGFHLRVQPADPGWVDLCFESPLLDSARARSYLGWQPRHGAIPALLELLDGLRTGASFDTPPLRRTTLRAQALEPAPRHEAAAR